MFWLVHVLQAGQVPEGDVMDDESVIGFLTAESMVKLVYALAVLIHEVDKSGAAKDHATLGEACSALERLGDEFAAHLEEAGVDIDETLEILQYGYCGDTVH